MTWVWVFNPRQIALRSLLLLAAAVVFGVVFNSFSPSGIPLRDDFVARPDMDAKKAGLTEVSIEEAAQAVKPESGFVVIDARPIEEYDLGHLPGALSAPTKDLAQSRIFIKNASPKDGKILVYCRGRSCADAMTLSKALKEDGFTRVHIFFPGYEAWKAGNYPIEK